MGASLYEVERMEDWQKRRKELKKFYDRAAWRVARENALMRDRYLCVLCKKQGDIKPADVVHHKIHLSLDNMDNPKIAYNLDNLISLCSEHHVEVHRGEHGKGRMNLEEHPYNYTFDANGMLVPKA